MQAHSQAEKPRDQAGNQLGSNLMGVLYVLDEPSIGLHREIMSNCETLQTLRDLGNTLIVVEHDEDTIRAADYVRYWSRSGDTWRYVVAEGTPSSEKSGISDRQIPVGKADKASAIRRQSDSFIRLRLQENNLKDVDANIP